MNFFVAIGAQSNKDVFIIPRILSLIHTHPHTPTHHPFALEGLYLTISLLLFSEPFRHPSVMANRISRASSLAMIEQPRERNWGCVCGEERKKEEGRGWLVE